MRKKNLPVVLVIVIALLVILAIILVFNKKIERLERQQNLPGAVANIEIKTKKSL